MTLLSEGYSARVLWQEAATPHPVATSGLPDAVDAVVVGGGYAGLSATAELSRRGRSVALLDAHDLGWGASTRNGGMVLPELKAGPRTLERRHGELGLRLHQEVEDAFDHVEALVAGGIDCSYERTGQLYLTHSTRGRGPPRCARRGAGVRRISPRTWCAVTTSPPRSVRRAFVAGLVVERSGGIHPARFHAGLVDRAAGTDASLHPHTPATAVARRGERWTVTTPRGAIDAGEVLVTTNAYADALVPALRRRVLPMGSYIIATEPLEPGACEGGAPHRPHVLQRPEPPLVLASRRRGSDGLRRPQAARPGRPRRGPRLPLCVDARRCTRSSPACGWSGHGAATWPSRSIGSPTAVSIDGLWYATGCNGSGVALNTWLGHRMAGALCGESLPAFAELEHRAIPFHALRRAWLPMVSAWFRFQDRRA